MQAPDRVDRFQFGEGYATTVGTLETMANVLQKEHLDPRIRTRMRQILRAAQLDSMDMNGEILAVWNFILSNVRYVRDPLGAEHITAPVELDKEVDDGSAMEDCESIALYAATLLASIGIPSQFEIQGRRPSRPDRFTHCALVVQNPRTKEWISFDPIGYWEYPGQFWLGDTLHRQGEPLQRFDLFGQRAQGVTGSSARRLVTALLGDSYTDLKTTEKYTTPAANILSQLGPYGMIIGAAIQGGTALADTQIHPSQIPGSGAAASSGSTASSGARPIRMLTTQAGLRAAQAAREDDQAAADEGKKTSLGGPLLALGAGLLAAKLLF